MRICRACLNWSNGPHAKRVEPEWLSANGLCPTCQKRKGALQIARQREGKALTNATNAA